MNRHKRKLTLPTPTITKRLGAYHKSTAGLQQVRHAECASTTEQRGCRQRRRECSFLSLWERCHNTLVCLPSSIEWNSSRKERQICDMKSRVLKWRKNTLVKKAYCVGVHEQRLQEDHYAIVNSLAPLRFALIYSPSCPLCASSYTPFCILNMGQQRHVLINGVFFSGSSFIAKVFAWTLFELGFVILILSCVTLNN